MASGDATESGEDELARTTRRIQVRAQDPAQRDRDRSQSGERSASDEETVAWASNLARAERARETPTSPWESAPPPPMTASVETETIELKRRK